VTRANTRNKTPAMERIFSHFCLKSPAIASVLFFRKGLAQ
jgi:hypothetical protein